MKTVLRFSSCCTDRFHSVHSGALMVPTIEPTAGGLNLTPGGSASLILLKLSVMLNASADCCHVAGAPFGSNGTTPVTASALLILKETDDGGFPSRLSTNPHAGSP